MMHDLHNRWSPITKTTTKTIDNMKTIKKPLLALAALATALGGTAHAGNVYIVGAQATRKSVTPAIRAIPGIQLIGTSGATTNNSDVDNAVFNLFKKADGTFIGIYWNGGEAAVRALLATNAAFAKVPFISTNTTPGTANISTNSLLTDTSGVTADLIQPTLAVANTSAAISRFNGTTLSQFLPGATTATPQKYQKAANDVKVDVSTYGFAADRNWTNTGVTSITAAQARVLFKYGNAPLSLFTGNSADSNATVWLSGRDIDAGARVNVYNEVGAGGLSDTYNHKAFAYVTNGGVKTISAIGLWPATQVDGLAQKAGNAGWAQGSDSIKNVYSLLGGTNLQYVTTGNKVITAVTTNFTATNIVTNPSVGVNSNFGGTFSPVDPATGYTVALKVIGKTNTYSTFTIASYYKTTNYYTNAAVNLTDSPAARSVFTTNSDASITNQWTKDGANYLLTYESLANIGNNSNNNGNGQLPIFLSYNGVGAAGAVATPALASTVATTYAANGGYTLWNYDHILLNSNGVASATVTGVRDFIQSYLATNVAAPNLKLSAQNINGAGDGATAYPVGISNQ